MNPDILKAYSTLKAHAGYVVGEHSKTCLHVARLAVRARELGCTFEWEPERESYTSVFGEGEDIAPELGVSVWADMLNAAMSEVDWYEIAKHYLSDKVRDDCMCKACGEEQDSDSIQAGDGLCAACAKKGE
jgi:hypothetical protein